MGATLQTFLDLKALMTELFPKINDTMINNECCRLKWITCIWIPNKSDRDLFGSCVDLNDFQMMRPVREKNTYEMTKCTSKE